MFYYNKRPMVIRNIGKFIIPTLSWAEPMSKQTHDIINNIGRYANKMIEKRVVRWCSILTSQIDPNHVGFTYFNRMEINIPNVVLSEILVLTSNLKCK